jgi:GTP-binding protein HflX
MESDLLLHVVDVTHPHAQAQVQAVEDTLEELEVDTLPRLITLNKIDRLSPDQVSEFKHLEQVIPISARTGQGIEELLNRVDMLLYKQLRPVHIKLPYSAGDLLATFHEQGSVDQMTHLADGVDVVGHLPDRLFSPFLEYLVNDEIESE